jgi:hypothetical protein
MVWEEINGTLKRECGKIYIDMYSDYELHSGEGNVLTKNGLP